MKDIIAKIIEFILNLFKKNNNETTNDNTNETTEDEVIENTEETNNELEDETDIIEPEVEDVPQIEIEEKTTIKEYQTMLKKIGLYTKSIDGIVGSGTKKAIKQFNIIFLKENSEEYSEGTDRLLKIIYNAYCTSKYMTDDLWQHFKNFKKSEYKCHCNGKYCNSYPSEISIHIVMTDQYIRNKVENSVTISSGLRCQKWNDLQSGSVKNSKHIIGRASDTKAKGKTAKQQKAIALELPFVYYSYCITKYYIHKSVNL